MTAPGVIVLSERRLLADAIGLLLDDAPVRHSADQHTLRAMITSDPMVTVVIDLEAPGMATEDLVGLLDGHRGRRCSVYDRFTPAIAATAFELGSQAPLGLDSPVDALRSALTGTAGTTITRADGPTRQELDRLAMLSTRELEVLRAVAQGRSASAIAADLGVTTHTVNTHRRRAMRKLDVVQQVQAVGLLARAGAVISPQT